MSSKLLDSLQSQFDKDFASKIDAAWRDQNNYIHREDFLTELYYTNLLIENDITTGRFNDLF